MLISDIDFLHRARAIAIATAELLEASWEPAASNVRVSKHDGFVAAGVRRSSLRLSLSKRSSIVFAADVGHSIRGVTFLADGNRVAGLFGIMQQSVPGSGSVWGRREPWTVPSRRSRVANRRTMWAHTAPTQYVPAHASRALTWRCHPGGTASHLSMRALVNKA